MVYHPHVHFVVPGGGVSEDGTKWLSTPENYLFPHAAAIWIYKAKFADAMRRAGLYDQVPAEAWRGKWVVDIKPVGDGLAVTKYLAPYVYRVAISDKRIVACDKDSVTYRYTPSGKKRAKTRTVGGNRIHPRLRATLPAPWVSESPPLWLAEPEHADRFRVGEVAGVVVLGLDVLAR